MVVRKPGGHSAFPMPSHESLFLERGTLEGCLPCSSQQAMRNEAGLTLEMRAATNAEGVSPSAHTERPSTTPAPRRLSAGKPCFSMSSAVLDCTSEPGTPKKSSEIACAVHRPQSSNRPVLLSPHDRQCSEAWMSGCTRNAEGNLDNEITASITAKRMLVLEHLQRQHNQDYTIKCGGSTDADADKVDCCIIEKRCDSSPGLAA